MIMRRLSFTSLLRLGLVAAVFAASAASQIVQDRMITDVRLVRDSARGTWRVTAVVAIASRPLTSPVNLSYILRTTQGDASGPQLAPDVSVGGVIVTTSASCSSAAPGSSPPCGGGTCPPLTVGGQTVSGTCEPYLVIVTGCTPYQICACYYRGIETDTASGIEVDPGDRVTVQLMPAPGAQADAPCTLPNDALTVTVGSRADEPLFHGPWREPTPAGGQRDIGGTTGGTSLRHAGLVRQGDGPFEFWGLAGATVTLQHRSPLANAPISLFVGPPKTSDFVDPVQDWSVDLDLTRTVAVYDGLFGMAPPVSTGANGVFAYTMTLPGGPSRRLYSVQGVSPDPAFPSGFALTSRNDVGVQSATLPPPDLPPLSATATGLPPYPWPRDAIVPNNGPPPLVPGQQQGTLHSLVGVGFDASDPSQNQITVNGVAADIEVVRPFEILFRLRPDHRSGLGGPVTVTTPSGTINGDADRMEHQVFVVPPESLVRQGAVGTSGVTVAGGFRSRPGIQAGRGSVTAADSWNLGWGSIPVGTQVTVLLTAVDDLTGQFVARCQAPTTCFSPLNQPFTQSPTFSIHGDVRLDIVPGSPLPQTTLFDDEGPGSSAFGTFATPSSAPSLFVGLNAASGATTPVSYVLLVSY
jgi:hypothetical protein